MKTLKYRIQDILDQLPAKTSRTARKEIPTLIGVSPGHFGTMIKFEIDSANGISSNQLIQIAWYFNQFDNCSVDDLLNKELALEGLEVKTELVIE